MMKRRICVMMTTVILAVTPIVINAEEMGVVTADYLNVREGASTSDAIVGGLSNGEEVTITEVTDNGWCEITYGNGNGYVSSDYVTTDPEAVVPEDIAYEEAGAAEAAVDEGTEVSDASASQSEGWDGAVLTPSAGVVYGPSGKETYYNLNMSGVVDIMRSMGNNDEYWVREDGVKMLGDYVMCAANLSVHPRGSLVESSLGTCIVCDTGGFAASNPNQLDIAVTW